MAMLPAFRAICDAAAQADPPYWERSAAEARALGRAGIAFLTGTPAPVAGVDDRTIPGPGGAMPVRVYRPLRDASAADVVPGALVYLHGGGFTMCDLDTHDALCRDLCARAVAVVVSVGYRLAPEHPFPAAVDDALAATRWVQDHASELGVDPARIAVGGDSAGGNLAAVVALAWRAGSRPPLVLQLLCYPGTDRRGGYESQRLFGTGFLLEDRARAWFVRCYVPAGADIEDWRLSPLCAPSVEGVAPAMVVTAECDPLRDEGDAYAARLAAAGVRVEHCRAEGMIHGFLQYAAIVPEVAPLLDRIGARLRAALA